MINMENLVKQITEQVLKELVDSKTQVGQSVPSDLEKQNYRPPSFSKKALITAEHVEKAARAKMNLEVPSDSIITPLAYETAMTKKVKIIINNNMAMQSYKSKLDKKIEKIAIGSDHGGYHLKEKIKDYLHSMGYMYEDFGTHSTKSVDYPDYAALVARAVSSGQCDKGIVIDGAGIGSCIVANKVNGILGALCHDRFTARIAREHDNANILCLGAKVVNDMESREILRTFLNTPFAGGRHTRRIDKILEVEKQETKQKGEPPKC